MEFFMMFVLIGNGAYSGLNLGNMHKFPFFGPGVGKTACYFFNNVIY